MKKTFDRLLWGVAAILLMIMLAIFLRHYLGMESIGFAPGRKLNNPLAALLATLCLLAATDPARRTRWLSRIRQGFTAPRAGWFFAGLTGLEGLLLYLHLQTHNHPLWDLDFERGLGTYVSTLLLFSLACLAFAARDAERGAPRPAPGRWALAGALFLFLALDECVGIHDEISDRAVFWLKDRAAFHAVHEWLWIYAPGLALAAGFLVLFLWQRTRGAAWARVSICAGLALWVTALALEAVNHPGWVLSWKLTVGLEEAAEMLGATLLLFGISRYIAALSRRGSAAGSTVP